MADSKSNITASLFFVLLTVVFLGCSEQPTPLVRVDMAAEHDAGRFNPELGDRLAIAGSFNNWSSNETFLEDPDGDWIYEIALADLGNIRQGRSRLRPQSNIAEISNDTLSFKFIIQTPEGRTAPNRGWETLGNRNLTPGMIAEHEPVMTYNEPWSPLLTQQITFIAGMSNQIVLGFFDPQRGDRVVVTGTFCDWSAEGLELTDPDGDHVYRTELPISFEKGEEPAYKFRIIPGDAQTILPNRGWEHAENRVLKLQKKDPAQLQQPGFAAFNNQRRVARFVVNTLAWERQGLFEPDNGDLLQIKLRLDDTERLTNPLVKVDDHTWEQAVMVPMNVEVIDYKIKLNNNISLIDYRRGYIAIGGTEVVMKDESKLKAGL